MAAADTASVTATASMGAASAAAEYDSLICQAQMIILMDRNASSAPNESLSALYAKNMHHAVMR